MFTHAELLDEILSEWEAGADASLQNTLVAGEWAMEEGMTGSLKARYEAYLRAVFIPNVELLHSVYLARLAGAEAAEHDEDIDDYEYRIACLQAVMTAKRRQARLLSRKRR